MGLKTILIAIIKNLKKPVDSCHFFDTCLTASCQTLVFMDNLLLLPSVLIIPQVDFTSRCTLL